MYFGVSLLTSYPPFGDIAISPISPCFGFFVTGMLVNMPKTKDPSAEHLIERIEYLVLICGENIVIYRRYCFSKVFIRVSKQKKSLQ